MNAPAPRVSVVIPVFNCDRYLGAALGSVLAQTGVDFDVLVSDNASTDRTAEIVRSFGDERVRYLYSTENVGAVPNWNAGMAQATGEYVKLFHADDLLYDGCLAKQAAVLDANPGVALMCGPHDIIDERGRRVMTRGLRRPGVIGGREAVRMMARRGTNLIGEPSGVMMRTSAYRAAGPFTESARYVVDLEMWVRLLLEGDLYVMAETLSAYRIQRGSWSNDLAASQTGDFRALLRQLAADPRFGVSGIDVALGTLGAWRNTKLRRVFYALYLRGEAPDAEVTDA